MQMDLRIVKQTLVLLPLYVSFSYGQPAEQQEVDMGITECTVRCIQGGTKIASGIDKLSCYFSRKHARHWPIQGFAMSFASDIDKLACSVSHKDARRKVLRGFLIFSKETNQVSADVCSFVKCKSNTRCVERSRGGAICVENWKSTFNNGVDKDGEDEEDGEDNNEITRKGSNPVESTCSSNTDCPTDRMFVCYGETCKCEPGYSFNPSNNSCVRRCTSYGDSFTTYYSLGIHGHNDGSSTTSLKGCHQQCIRAKKFTCITCETHVWNRRCFISKSGYLDVAPTDRENGSDGLFWRLSVRNCA